MTSNAASLVDATARLTAAIGPRVRKSPLFDRTVEAGLTSVSAYNHMWLPMSYGNPEAEYTRLTEGVTMWDVSAQRHIEVSGIDADELVQKVTVVDVQEIDTGAGGYAPVVDHAGVLINDPVLLRFDDGSWRFSIADSDLRLWLAAVAAEASLDVRVRELDTVTIAVQGPLAGAVLDRLEWPRVDDLDDFERRTVQIDQAVVIVSRSGWSSQGGVELFVDDPEKAISVWDALVVGGEENDIGPGAPNPAERIENVLLSYGTDTGYDANAIELGLEDVIDFDHGPFIGRDALLAIRAQGPARRLRGVEIDGDPVRSLPHPVPIEGGALGELRAAARAPRFDQNLGLALTPSGIEPGAAGRVRLPEGERGATVVDLPFVGASESTPGGQPRD